MCPLPTSNQNVSVVSNTTQLIDQHNYKNVASKVQPLAGANMEDITYQQQVIH